MTIAPENFMFLRLSLGMSVEQCAAYLRTSVRTVGRWENGTVPAPFAEFELLRMVFESVGFKLSHSEWDGWFISTEGKLVSPFDGVAHTPDDINLMSLTHSIKAGLEIENTELKKALAEAAAENTRLRQLFLSDGVVDELYSLHGRMNDLIQQLATAHVLPFPGQSSDKVEKAA